GGLDVERAGVDTGFEGGCERVSDGRHLRLGEDDAGRQRAGGARVDACLATENRVYRDACLVLRHVCEERVPVRVSDRVEPILTRHAHALVDLDVATGLEPDRLQAQLTRCRAATDRAEGLIRLE